ncbi:MAG: restriction system-associated AAA family ATPase [Candidatus Cyclobacteriaceae bacterium M2_1C_046]
MKLVSVKILGDDFRSLANNKLYEFNVSSRKNRLSTKIFAGLNGSGKSNFLELLSEIFYYLEIYHLKSATPLQKKGKNIGFEIEYILPIDNMVVKSGSYDFEDKGCHVRIIKKMTDSPEFTFKKYGDEKFIRLDDATEFLLPSKVIAYTSGQNELLSNPFFKIRYHYFKELSKEENTTVVNAIENEKMFFLDTSSNFSIFISNMLLANPEKLKYLKDVFQVEELHAFRITINLVDYQKNKIPLTESVLANIEKLKNCSTSWIKRTKGKEEFIIIDYKVNQATHEAFKFHFTSSFELFQALYELENLNLHLVAKDTRSLILKAHKSLNLTDEMPRPDPSRLIFRIEKIFLNKIVEVGKPTKQIYYKGLSDGEHQFNEVLGSVMMMEQDGCLFLMDEPDTHFNPKWRAKLIEMLNQVSAVTYDSKGKPETVRKQEIIITTHSPFVISDSYKEDVYKFEKGDFETPDLQTYGGSVGMILETIFDRDISISDFSNDDLNQLKASIKTLGDVQRVKKELLKFGESVEKFDAYSFLQLKEEELKNKEKK